MAQSIETLWVCDEQDGVQTTMPGDTGTLPTGWAHVTYEVAGQPTQAWDLCPNSLQQTIGTIASTIAALPSH